MQPEAERGGRLRGDRAPVREYASAHGYANQDEAGMENGQAQDAALRERATERMCLYSLARRAERFGMPLAEILQGTVTLPPL